MLKQRLITAAVLIFIILMSVFTLSSDGWGAIMAVFIVPAAWEWSRLAGWTTPPAQAGYTLSMALLLIIAWFFKQWLPYLLIAACIWWLTALFWLIEYQRGHDITPSSKFAKTFMGFIVLLPAWAALFLLHEHYGVFWLLFLLTLVSVADSAAYFSGRRWGKTKLADKISPGKTRAGVAGAVLAGAVMAVSYALMQQMAGTAAFVFVLLCILTVLASISGDLTESLLKRQAGLKDSGRILPGHGGILDRIDSQSAAAPVFVAGLYPLEYIL
ncbi:MAG: phosphatidate cytidylyltransferase [Gammaproteobacteria bacterium]|nr:phosphatidate cytidylyltransferase [Gammaproteobacteria bacterium]